MSVLCSQKNYRYVGYGLFNGADVGQRKHLKRIRSHIEKDKPDVSVITPPCTAFSSAQNGNRRTGKQRRQLIRKRIAARRIFKNAFELAVVQVSARRLVLAEQPLRCASWKRTAWCRMKRLLRHGATVRACAVGMKSLRTKKPLSKQWHFRTNNLQLAKALRKFSRCKCRPGTEHTFCIGGKETQNSAKYPPQLCKTIVCAAFQCSGGCAHATEGLQDNVTRSIAATITPSWRRKHARAHWSKRPARARIIKLLRVAGAKAKRTSAPQRKRCRGFVPSCLGGLSVTTKDVEARARLRARYGKVRIYCRRCLAAYVRKYCSGRQ